MNITSDLLNKWSACADGYAYFIATFPQGSDYATIQAKLRTDNHLDWSRWLTENAWRNIEASQIATLVKAEVDDALEATKDSPNSASGDYSTAASSGDSSKAASSGNYSKAASSGDYSTAASSGNYSKAASSGDFSTAAAEGKNTVAMVAGNNGRAKAGENGCIALAYWTGERYRIVCGHVGEDIKADTWYRVEGGKLVEATN